MFQESISMLVKNDIDFALGEAAIDGVSISVDPDNKRSFEISIRGTMPEYQVIGINPELAGKNVSYIKYIAYDENKKPIDSVVVSTEPKSKEVRSVNKKALALLSKHCAAKNN